VKAVVAAVVAVPAAGEVPTLSVPSVEFPVPWRQDAERVASTTANRKKRLNMDQKVKFGKRIMYLLTVKWVGCRVLGY
jgi:hypothetical protein